MDSEQIREIAREEAHNVYDEYTIIDTDGKQTTFGALQQRINAIAPDLNRRETFKLAAVAFGYIGMGFTITGAVGKAVFGSVRADATGEDGTQADPLTKLWVHEIESGDGASGINIPDAVSLEDVSVSDNVNFATEQQTISAGELSYTSPVIYPRGESGSADDLTHITGATDGDIVILGRPNPGENITVVDGSGSPEDIHTAGGTNFVLDDAREQITLVYLEEALAWVEIASTSR